MGKQSDLWGRVSKHYEMVRNAEVANSFLCLLALSEAGESQSTTQISQTISAQSKGTIYKLSATLKSSLENLRNLGLVEGHDISNAKKTLYKITPKGKTLLKGWRGFVEALD